MTNEERNAVIGKLVQSYADNEKTFAALNVEIKEFHLNLGGLSRWLERPDDIVSLKHNGKSVFALKQNEDERIEADISKLHALLNAYHDALDKKDDMAKSLRQAGLEKIIG